MLDLLIGAGPAPVPAEERASQPSPCITRASSKPSSSFRYFVAEPAQAGAGCASSCNDTTTGRSCAGDDASTGSASSGCGLLSEPYSAPPDGPRSCCYSSTCCASSRHGLLSDPYRAPPGGLRPCYYHPSYFASDLRPGLSEQVYAPTGGGRSSYYSSACCAHSRGNPSARPTRASRDASAQRSRS